MIVTVYNLKNVVAESASVDEVAPLIAAVKATVEPLHWDVNGGKGAISLFVPSPDNFWRLVIRADSAVHKEIAELLDTLSQASP